MHQAHYLIARVTLHTQQLEIALKALEEATQLAPSQSEYWAFLALLYSQIGRLEQAENAALMAYNLGHQNAYVLHPLAHVLGIFGHTQKCLDSLKQACLDSPQNPVYHRAYGLALLENGDLASAEYELKATIEIDPNDAEAWWLLSSVVKATDNEMANKTLMLSQAPMISSRQVSFFAYAAGKFFEDTGSWESAFSAFERGAVAKRKTLNYDSKRASSTFESIRNLCTADWLKQNEYQTSKASPIFIVGQPRTGTTLIERVLSSHSEVSSAGEPVQFLMALRALSSVRSQELIPAELIEKSLSLSNDLLAKTYITGLGKLTGNTQMFIDKFPMNYMLLGFILKAFPNAKIIHVTRHPIDTCFAVYKQLFEDVYPHSYDQQEMAEHYVEYHNLMQHWHSIMPGKILDIAYEDIIDNMPDQAFKLIEHLGLNWEEACANFEYNKSVVQTASAAQVREKVYARSKGRWQKYRTQLAPTIQILEAAGFNIK